MDECEVTRSDVNLSFAVSFYTFKLNTPIKLGNFSCRMCVPKVLSFFLQTSRLEY